MDSSDRGSKVGQPEETPAASQPRPEPNRARLDRLLREVTLRLVDEEDSEQLQRTLADTLAASQLYTHAWVGNRVNRSPAAHVGDDSVAEVLGAVAVRESESADFETHGRIDAVPAPVVQRIAADIGVDVPRVRAARIPLEARGLACGTAVVATPRDGPVEQSECAALAEVGRVAGFALDTAVYRTLLVSDGSIEVVLELDHATRPTGLTVLANAYDSTVELERLLPRAEGAKLRVDVEDPDPDPSTVTGSDVIEGGSVTDASAAGASVEFVVAPESPLATLAASGVVIAAAVADPNRLRVTVQGGATGLEILRSFRAQFPSTTCLAKRQVPKRSTAMRADGALDRAGLTEKQETVLELALSGGFFERPRRQTGQELADELGVSDSTFHQHLRDGVCKLVETVIDD